MYSMTLALSKTSSGLSSLSLISSIHYYLYPNIMNTLVVFPQLHIYIDVFDIMNPQYNEQISPVPWHFVKSRFHCTCVLQVELLRKNMASVLKGEKYEH